MVGYDFSKWNPDDVSIPSLMGRLLGYRYARWRNRSLWASQYPR